MQTTGYDADAYRQAKDDLTRMGATEGIDAVLSRYNLDALIVPSEGFATRPSAVAGISTSCPIDRRLSNCKCSSGNADQEWTTVWIIIHGHCTPPMYFSNGRNIPSQR